MAPNLQTLTKPEKRKIIGERLKEMISAHGFSQAKLIHQTRLINGKGFNMTSAQMSMIINGKRSLPQEFAFKFAEILHIDSGYLTGQDNYRAADYNDYLKIMDSRVEYNEAITAYTKYDSFLDPFGYKVVSLVMDSKTSIYGLKHRHAVAKVPGEKLDQFIEDVKNYMKKKLDLIMQEYQAPDLDDIDFESIDLHEVAMENPGEVREVLSDEER